MFRKHLLEKGWDPPAAEAVERKLRVADYALSPETRLPVLAKDWSLATSELEELESELVPITDGLVVASTLLGASGCRA